MSIKSIKRTSHVTKSTCNCVCFIACQRWLLSKWYYQYLKVSSSGNQRTRKASLPLISAHSVVIFRSTCVYVLTSNRYYLALQTASYLFLSQVGWLFNFPWWCWWRRDLDTRRGIEKKKRKKKGKAMIELKLC